MDQCPSDFQTGIGAAAHTTLDMELLISHSRMALLDTITSLHDSDGGMIPVQEVLELLSKSHDILDNALSKQVGKTTHISASLFSLLLGSVMKFWLFITPSKF